MPSSHIARPIARHTWRRMRIEPIIPVISWNRFQFALDRCGPAVIAGQSKQYAPYIGWGAVCIFGVSLWGDSDRRAIECGGLVGATFPALHSGRAGLGIAATAAMMDDACVAAGARARRPIGAMIYRLIWRRGRCVFGGQTRSERRRSTAIDAAEWRDYSNDNHQLCDFNGVGLAVASPARRDTHTHTHIRTHEKVLTLVTLSVFVCISEF